MQPLSPSYVIREARRQDVPAILALWREMMEFHAAVDPRFRFARTADREMEQHLISTIRSQGGRIVVAEYAGEVVGYILGELHGRKPIYPEGIYGFVSDLSVTAAHRRHGVGRALAEEMLAWFRKGGATAVELFVSERNPASTAFWESLGFGGYLRLLRREMEGPRS